MAQISFSLFLFLLLAGLAIGDPVVKFFLLHISAIFLTIWVFMFLRERNRLFNITYIVLISHATGIAGLLYYLFTAQNDLIYNNEYQIYIYDHVEAISLSVFIPIISITFISFLLKERKGSPLEFMEFNYNPSPLLMIFTLFISVNTIVFNAFFLLGRSLPVVGYVATVIHASFSLFTFWVGYWNVRLKWVFPIVFFSILVDAVVSILWGGRFIFFVHVALLFIGYVVSVPKQRRRTLIIAAVVTLPLVYSLIAVMGVVRDKIGRGDEVSLQEGRIELYVNAFSEVIEGNSGISDEELNDLGKGRNLNWPNYSVMALSPEIIPYVGFDNLENEINAIFTISGINSGATSEAITESRNSQIEKGLGTGMANRYGFRVNESNSVEWSLLADTWSKGGPLIYLISYSFLFFIFILYETRISTTDNFSRLVYTLVLVRIVMFISSSLPFYFVLRSILWDTIFAFLIIWAFLSFKKYIKF